MRVLSRIIVVLTIATTCLPSAEADAAPGTPSDVVRHFFDTLLANMKNGEALGAKGRFEKLEPVVRAAFDIPFMTKMSIGLGWGRLTADQKQRAAKAFGRYVAATYATQFDKFSGESFNILGEQKVPHGTIVRTRLVPTDDEPVAINYMLHDNDAAWQIRDVYLTGTVSELATKRSEFSAILRSGGIDALIARLNQRADAL